MHGDFENRLAEERCARHDLMPGMVGLDISDLVRVKLEGILRPEAECGFLFI